MTQPPQPTERFAQHPRLAELVTALGFRRDRLFLAGLLYQEPGGPLRRATAVVSREGDLVAYDAGEVVEHAGHLPTSRLFDDDLTGRSPTAMVDALAERNQAFFAHEGGITGSEVLGVVPLGSPTPSWMSAAPWPTATSAAPGRAGPGAARQGWPWSVHHVRSG